MSEEKYIKYVHWEGYEPVTVRTDLKGQHRNFCLCQTPCEFFKPNTPENCEIAHAVYENCIKFGITTPMWECPRFKKR